MELSAWVKKPNGVRGNRGGREQVAMQVGTVINERKEASPKRTEGGCAVEKTEVKRVVKRRMKKYLGV